MSCAEKNLKVKPFVAEHTSVPVSVILCLSGVGSNAEVLLKRVAAGNSGFKIAVLFTDQPEKSSAFKLGERFNVPVEALDIDKFYAEHGETDAKLSSPRRFELRELWSQKVWELLQPYQASFAVFAGFVPLNSLPDKLPCLNVHPGDLTVANPDGSRRYAGLHIKPVETAILDGNSSLRSSVIMVQSPGADGKFEIDGGEILGISAPVPVELMGAGIEDLRSEFSARTKPPYQDRLREIARKNVENLKIHGDHVVLPLVTEAFARGRLGNDEKGNLCFKTEKSGWVPARTVEFNADGSEKVIRKAKLRNNFIVRTFKYLYLRMVRGSGSPEYIARGWALGMFVGCVVPVFCQLIVAIPLSFPLRGSKIGAALGTFITTPPTAIFIYPVLIWVGNKVIGGNLSADAASGLLKVFTDDTLSFWAKWNAFLDMGGELLGAFFAGGLLWAAIMTPLTYFGVKYLVIRYRKIREKIRLAREGKLI